MCAGVTSVGVHNVSPGMVLTDLLLKVRLFVFSLVLTFVPCTATIVQHMLFKSVSTG